MANKYYYRLLVLFIFLSGIAWQAKAQAVQTIPEFPNGDQEITLIFDLKQAKDGRAAGLLGKTDDVYLWSGAGVVGNSNAFQYQPAGQTSFNQPFNPGKMTSLGNDRWQIKLTPRTYFGVPAGQTIDKLGLLLKNGSGTAQTEDFIIKIYDGSLQIALQEPEQQNFFVAANSAIPVRAVVSAAADVTVKLDNTVIYSASNTDQVQTSVNAGNQQGVLRTVTIEAKRGTETATQTFTFRVRPQPVVAALPAGMRDGVNYTSATTATLVLFAPHKQFVYAIGEFNNWETSPAYLMKRTPDGNRYWIELSNLPAGQEVAYQYLVDGTLAVADPYTEKILDPAMDQYIPTSTYPNLKAYPAGAEGIVSILQTNQPGYTWKVTNFERPDPENLVIYELHVRDFIEARNYKVLADTLTYLKRLGINAIELMPVMEFSGNDSWGYNPIFFFAPDKAYGTKNDLKAFIDKAHEMGIAVILDIVLNQADYEYPYVKMYWDGNQPAANSPFFNQRATHPFSVFFDFNHESEASKALVERVNRHWLEEYNIDGYRFDLSKGFTQKNTGDNVGSWSAYDAGRIATWKRIYDEIRSYDETAYVILEHFADNQEEQELASYGMLFWGNHNHDYRNLAKGVQANPQGISYKVREWEQPHLIGYMESHDEERMVYDVVQNGNRNGSYNTRTLATALDRAKLAATFFLPIPGPKMIWQFGELGYNVSIDQNGRTGQKPIRWEYQQQPDRQKLYQVYAELIKLKLNEPAFATDDFELQLNGQVKRIFLFHDDMNVFIVGNFDVRAQQVNANFPKTGAWYDYFTGRENMIDDPGQVMELQPGEFHIYTSKKLATPQPGLVPWQGLVLSAEEELAERGVTVYPNPMQEATLLHLDGDYRGPVQVQLVDMTGRQLQQVRFLKHLQSHQEQLRLQRVPAGIYYMQVEQGGKKSVHKLLKVSE
ncbi:alpha-amylase family glycosyl hydrolase [Pontibacter indicus]|uniref:Por secretion system C-terminal sorting domain-containing protein n=1 Tax=Pontibacter indicus TaxID=1317125 RepID=A0A1R3X203_9BACT|nr:alpha-amylase family glycosyl hydrolase [Pontibacter indicus]SIT84515.1 Por secretion system C-terminal sorting domain-containing protein [Pontibacter indicus]